MTVVCGIFVGGASRRMGQTKGLLPAPDGSGRSLVARLTSELKVAAPGAPLFLIGRHGEYAPLELPFIDDEEPRRGPLSGLVALLAKAEETGADRVLAVACDHPYLEAALLGRLLHEHDDAAICAPYLDERFQPLVARYATGLLAEFRAALSEGNGALQPLLHHHGAARLSLSKAECDSLRDWDTPVDREG